MCPVVTVCRIYVKTVSTKAHLELQLSTRGTRHTAPYAPGRPRVGQVRWLEKRAFPAKASRGNWGSVNIPRRGHWTGRGGEQRAGGGAICKLLTTVKLYHFHVVCLGVTKWEIQRWTS